MVVFNGVNIHTLKQLLHFMYYGEIKVLESEIQSLLELGATLRVKGLGSVRLPPPLINQSDDTANLGIIRAAENAASRMSSPISIHDTESLSIDNDSNSAQELKTKSSTNIPLLWSVLQNSSAILPNDSRKPPETDKYSKRAESRSKSRHLKVAQKRKQEFPSQVSKRPAILRRPAKNKPPSTPIAPTDVPKQPPTNQSEIRHLIFGAVVMNNESPVQPSVQPSLMSGGVLKVRDDLSPNTEDEIAKSEDNKHVEKSWAEKQHDDSTATKENEENQADPYLEANVSKSNWLYRLLEYIFMST